MEVFAWLVARRGARNQVYSRSGDIRAVIAELAFDIAAVPDDVEPILAGGALKRMLRCLLE
jgi:hypothetical protein